MPQADCAAFFLKRREMIILSECTMCPRNCKVNRELGDSGYCKMEHTIRIGRAALHFWEEPSISGDRGSGAVFFSGCNLRCVFCQNRKISSENIGKNVSVEELAGIFLDLQNQGAHNINLVTPTHFSKYIAKAIQIAKENGLTLPVIYNCGGYESVSTLRELRGLIDIYMPDFKYFDNVYAKSYSRAPNYFEIASEALLEMFSQVGKNTFSEDGIMSKGVIVRHMLLPGLLQDSKKVIDYLYSNYCDDIYISIMSQYTPMPWVSDVPELNRKVSEEDYESLVEYAISLGIENAYIQEGGAADESFVPEFVIN